MTIEGDVELRPAEGEEMGVDIFFTSRQLEGVSTHGYKHEIMQDQAQVITE